MLLKSNMNAIATQRVSSYKTNFYKRKTTAISLYKRDAVVLIKRERK